jgi:hypothetical protein
MHKTLTVAGLAACVLAMAGCQPVAKVDTDGDGVSDRSMTESEVVAWQRREEAKAKAAADAIARDAKREVKAAQNQSDAVISDIVDEAQSKSDAVRLSLQNRQDAVSEALADIEAQRTVIDAVLSSPIVQGAAGSFPGGSALLGLAGVLLGGVAGNARGRKVGEDAGWNDRAQHQNEIDKAWEEATARKGGQ